MAVVRSQIAPGADLAGVEPGRAGGCEVVRPIGVIDASTAWVFRQAMAELPSPSRVVVDLSAVSFIDSAGLGAIIGGVRRVRELGGDLNLAGPRPSISRVFRATGVDRISDVHASVDDAVAAHRQSGDEGGGY